MSGKPQMTMQPQGSAQPQPGSSRRQRNNKKRRNKQAQDLNQNGPQHQLPQRGQPQALATRHVRQSDVNMPSGEAISVVIPARTCECRGNCSFKLRLTELRPQGMMGGREFGIISDQMDATIKQHNPHGGGGQFTSYDILKIEKIQNCCLWKKFRIREKQLHQEAGYVNERMLFHGSTAADRIAQIGFQIKCADHGGMFGPAIYFAEDSSKSNQYVFGHMGANGCPLHNDNNCYDCERKLLLCRVALGMMYYQKSANHMTQPPPGFHSVMGVVSPDGLKYPEYALYNTDQAYPEYLITYRIAE